MTADDSRRRFLGRAALAGTAGLTAVSGFVPAVAAPNERPSGLSLNVLDFGALGDGRSDDTRPVQKALDAAHAQGGGVVALPRGTYRLNSPLTVPPEVALQGVSVAPVSHAGLREPPAGRAYTGTTLLLTAGRGREDGPAAIALNGNSALRGVCVFYPDQSPDAPPAPYPWAIQMRGNNPTVENVELVNPYRAIDCTQNQRHLVRSVTGQPLRAGLWVDAIYDIGRVENVHWNPWWSAQPPVYEFQFRHGEAFVFGRADWEYVLNTFCFGYRYGYRFVETATGVCNGNFLGIGADDCWTSCQVDQAAPYGLLITNGEFVASSGELHPIAGADPAQVEVGPKHAGATRFVNCAFWGPDRSIARIGGAGTVGFSDCTLCAWDADHQDRPAIDAHSGTLLVRGCEFQHRGHHVRLGAPVARAVITGNVFAGPARITNAAHGDVQIGLNSAG